MIVIFYSDGSTYGDTAPELAPKRGVIAIVQPNGDSAGYHVIQQADYYLWRGDWCGGMWQGADRIGRLLYELDPGWKLCLFGESVPNSVYAKITKLALAQARELSK